MVTARRRGFTLIELLVTMAILAILATIALSTYQSSVRKSRRTDAKAALLDIAGREERYLSTNGTYTADPTQFGYPAGLPIAVGSGYYTVNVAVTAPAAGAAPTYALTATPVGTQVSDTGCASFTVTQTGQRTATNSSGADASTDCWR
jgi:type IV pilus assembly protein PilE